MREEPGPGDELPGDGVLGGECIRHVALLPALLHLARLQALYGSREYSYEFIAIWSG